jgi:hypothetical protein
MDSMRDRAITISGLNQLRLWIESQPEVPEGNGTKTSARSKSVVKANYPRHFS